MSPIAGTEQLDLVDLAWQAHEHARTSDRSTSHAAAASVRHGARAIMDQILGELRRFGPGTFSELALRCERDEAQVWKRLADLKNASLIEPTGDTRPGRSGRAQTVWRARS